MKLCSLARKIYNGLAYIVVEDVLSSMLELIYSVMMIQEDEYKSLSKYLEAIEHRNQVVLKSYVDIGSEELRDTYMLELETGDKASLKYTLS